MEDKGLSESVRLKK